MQETISNMDLRIKRHGEESSEVINKSMDEFRARLTEQQGQIRDSTEKLSDHRKRIESQ